MIGKTLTAKDVQNTLESPSVTTARFTFYSASHELVKQFCLDHIEAIDPKNTSLMPVHISILIGLLCSPTMLNAQDFQIEEFSAKLAQIINSMSDTERIDNVPSVDSDEFFWERQYLRSYITQNDHSDSWLRCLAQSIILLNR